MDPKKPTALERLSRIRDDSEFISEELKILMEVMEVHREINAKLTELNVRSDAIKWER